MKPITKRVYLLRHAKSSWKDSQIPDFDRPLNKRGEQDAPMMAHRLYKLGIHPDIILSSPAKRAKETAKYFAATLGVKILLDASIYEASPFALKQLIKMAFEMYDTIMLIGHNPSLTLLCNTLCDEPIDSIPTAGIVGIEFSSSNIDGTGKLLIFDYPKKYK
jgi:phosphohistidine phosphatase